MLIHRPDRGLRRDAVPPALRRLVHATHDPLVERARVDEADEVELGEERLQDPGQVRREAAEEDDGARAVLRDVRGGLAWEIVEAADERVAAAHEARGAVVSLELDRR